MSLSALLAVIWVFAATGVAMLPMRRQFPTGMVLIAAAPLLIAWLAYDYGWIAGIGALAAFVSMFRNPIRYYWRKWRGPQNPPQPEEPK
jgi:Protein of unknown function (DUF2484)